MTVYIGVDFHPYEQSVAYASDEDGEIGYRRFLHSDKQSIRAFYRKCGADAVIGGRPKAKVAAARKLLINCYVMLRDGIGYEEFQRRGEVDLCEGSGEGRAKTSSSGSLMARPAISI